MIIDTNTVRQLESLSCLTLTDAERDDCAAGLQRVIDAFGCLREIDTDGVEPLVHPFPLENVMREDEIVPSLDNEVLLENAARARDGCFVVPRTLE